MQALAPVELPRYLLTGPLPERQAGDSVDQRPLVAIPNLGNYSIAFTSVAEALGVRAWAATRTTPEAMKLGLEAAPESACLPFKAYLGLFIQAARAGVKYAVMVNSVGTCRLRYYRGLFQQVLDEMGFDMYVFGLGYDGLKPPLVRYFDPRPWPFLKWVGRAAVKMAVVDDIELAAWRTRPLELEPGATSRVMSQCLRELDQSASKRATQSLRADVPRRFAAIPVDPERRPFRVGLVGEVSVLRDRYLNHDLEDLLGRLGVEVRNFFLLGAELGNIFNLGTRNPNSRKRLMEVARPYLGAEVGGHAVESVAHTIRCAEQGWDGVVHVCPSGCMPEVSIRPLLRKISADLDIPVLPLSFDEHTSHVGVTTRLEAFVDVLRDRRRKDCQ